MAFRINDLFSGSTGTQRCPECDAVVEAKSINISEGVALCPQCGKLSRLSKLNFSDRSVEDILGQPPTGCEVVDLGTSITVTASLRSATGFFITAGVALFWNGIVSVFVLITAAGLYTNLIGPLPAWFPAPGMNGGQPQINGGPMDLGMALFLCVFLSPFVFVGSVMAGAALVNLMGKIEVVIDDLDSYVATGIGFLKWKKRFDATQLRDVDYGVTMWQTEGGINRLIELTADRTVKFGSLLTSERMEWMRTILRDVLLNSEGNPPAYDP